MPAVQETIERVRNLDIDQYKFGFATDIESDKAPKGLSEDTVCFISAKKNEPAWVLENGYLPRISLQHEGRVRYAGL
jgi:Fe-S cluster assembly protein SufB